LNLEWKVYARFDALKALLKNSVKIGKQLMETTIMAAKMLASAVIISGLNSQIYPAILEFLSGFVCLMSALSQANRLESASRKQKMYIFSKRI
jgi:thiamine monophosphate synthase